MARSLLLKTESSGVVATATLGRGENKAIMEGEFGNWDREVGALRLDDTSIKTLIMAAVREAIRAYTAGINHAARKELGGKSRVEVVRRECPDPKTLSKKDKAARRQAGLRRNAKRHCGAREAPALSDVREALGDLAACDAFGA